MIDQFGCKRYQEKRKDVSYQLFLQVFKKYFFVHERRAVKNSFSIYICTKWFYYQLYLGHIGSDKKGLYQLIYMVSGIS